MTSTTSTSPLVLATYPTPAGEAHAAITPEDGVVRLFGWLDAEANVARLAPALAARGIEEGEGPASVRDAVARYTAGDLDAIDAIAVDQPGGEFFTAAWTAMRRVRPGHPVTYTELATAAGRPAAVRAAASACARNRVALVVPCHRVVRTDGGLGGFYYGLEIKRALQDHEARAAA
ncbi:methylated-DNA--[protein]-cysteine S-methyltransferase [Litorihabitans aurantiacus]|uniref:Methylated-DNA:protein-cysteine methyltransferase n=1 Tax=Litorihabitans aurantiacus TaxID=1930061 RepID=A0AA37XGE0_9MICO|nr:methylated-DNA--[protein]-cysteine S-methyltransferase [Litorihabitans aurantiacus]GMA32673.1 putative methylated-DNA:protein-cysteine methyltransferase [Litorihabitans aurantiacus]